jgi:hypothetical protein
MYSRSSPRCNSILYRRSQRFVSHLQESFSYTSFHFHVDVLFNVRLHVLRKCHSIRSDASVSTFELYIKPAREKNTSRYATLLTMCKKPAQSARDLITFRHFVNCVAKDENVFEADHERFYQRDVVGAIVCAVAIIRLLVV